MIVKRVGGWNWKQKEDEIKKKNKKIRKKRDELKKKKNL